MKQQKLLSSQQVALIQPLLLELLDLLVDRPDLPGVTVSFPPARSCPRNPLRRARDSSARGLGFPLPRGARRAGWLRALALALALAPRRARGAPRTAALPQVRRPRPLDRGCGHRLRLGLRFGRGRGLRLHLLGGERPFHFLWVAARTQVAPRTAQQPQCRPVLCVDVDSGLPVHTPRLLLVSPQPWIRPHKQKIEVADLLPPCLVIAVGKPLNELQLVPLQPPADNVEGSLFLCLACQCSAVHSTGGQIVVEIKLLRVSITIKVPD